MPPSIVAIPAPTPTGGHHSWPKPQIWNQARSVGKQGLEENKREEKTKKGVLPVCKCLMKIIRAASCQVVQESPPFIWYVYSDGWNAFYVAQTGDFQVIVAKSLQLLKQVHRRQRVPVYNTLITALMQHAGPEKVTDGSSDHATISTGEICYENVYVYSCILYAIIFSPGMTTMRSKPLGWFSCLSGYFKAECVPLGLIG